MRKLKQGRAVHRCPCVCRGQRSKSRDVVVVRGSVREGLTKRVVGQALVEVRGHSRERGHKFRD